MRRRELLSGIALLGTGASLAKGPETAKRVAPPADLSDWENVRRQFPLDYRYIQMSQFFLASHPQPVSAAIEAHRRGLDQNPFLYVEENIERFERATREAAAAHLGCKPDDLAMTDSTTMGLGIFYNGLKLREGQEILSTTHDHPATFRALDFRAERTGATLRRVPLYTSAPDADPDQMAAALAREIKPKTRVVAVTWVHSSTGVRTPIARFAQVVAAANQGRAEADRAILCVDGVHGFGVEDETMVSLGCDMFAAGCHKWIFGPRGTGILYATLEAWAVSSPDICSFDRMWRTGPQMPPAAEMTPGGFHSFEHRWALAEAFRFHGGIGKARIAKRIHQLNEQCRRGLAGMKHVRLLTPMSNEVSAGLVCFNVEGMKDTEVVARLKEKKILASVTPRVYGVDCARFAPSLLTSPADVDASLRAVRALA
jgi:selenocysteine lyase/cysteine desulfurase